MKRILFISGWLALCAGLAAAQSPVLKWQAAASQPPSVTVSGYKVYRAPCTGTISAGTCSAEGAFTGQVVVGPTILTWTDTTAAAGSSYSYYVTTVCTSCTPNESVASNHFAMAVAIPQPNPPILLSVTSANLIRKGSNANLSATWINGPGTTTTWSLTADTAVGSNLGSGARTSASGNFSLDWSGKVNPNTTKLIFSVCDSVGNCVQRAL
jgi:hypothetical protein